MIIELKYNQSDNRRIRKTVIDGESIDGEMNQAFDILRPVVDIGFHGPMHYNYAYIPDFRRYYHIRNKTVIANGVYRLELVVDPWMSFQRDILNTQAVIDKSTTASQADVYIDDGSLVCDNYKFTRIVNFPSGFNDTPELILITMG